MTEEKRNNIIKMMDLNGNLKSNESIIIQIIELIYSKYGEEQNFRKITIEEIRSIIDAIIEDVVPIYDNNFSNEEILDIINFYESEVGKMYLKKMPVVSLESMKVGEKFGEKIYNMLQIKKE